MTATELGERCAAGHRSKARRRLPSLHELAGALAAVCGLPGYFRHPLTAPEARSVVAQRRAQREENLLRLARVAVYANPTSPYRALLRNAGCEYGDFEALVRREGVDEALGILVRNGVYLTVDEFKGRVAAVRGSATLCIDPEAMRNPLVTPRLWARTGGSRGRPRRVPLDLTCVRDRAVNMFLALDAMGGARWNTAIWGTTGLIPLLWYSSWGVPVSRWYSKMDSRALAEDRRLRWSARVLRMSARLAGVRIPPLEHVPVSSPLPIAAWITDTLAAGRTPHLWGAPSSVVRLCEAAHAAGLNLVGSRFTVTGEPVTATRLAVIRAAGGEAMPDYGSTDSGGTIAYACRAPEAADDVHVFDDLNAIVQAHGSPLPRSALLVSSLLPSSPLILLNVSMGDRATMVSRRCGCPMDSIGWSMHLHTVRSFEKLTAGGVTFEDTDVIRVLEEVLPRRFGGGPADFQLIEDAAGDGSPRLRLLVHPAIGPLDADAVVETFLDTISRHREADRRMSEQWRASGYLRVERAVPHVSEAGKILHLVGMPAATAGDSG